MLTLTQEDHDVFNGLNHHADMKKAIIALAGKEKKGEEDAEKDTDDEN